MKKFLAVGLSMILLAATLGGCGSASGKDKEIVPAKQESKDTQESGAAQSEADTKTESKDADGKVFKIGVIQYVEHAALDASYKGFIDGLDEAGIQYELDVQNAQGDQSTCTTIATKLVNDQNDLILAIATPAAQAVVSQTTDIPVLVTAVTDPESAGLVNSNDEPGVNVSGTSDATPVEAQIDLLKKLLPEAKTVGVLYCSAEQNSEFQLEQTKKACENAGLELKEFSVSSTNEIQQVTESMIGKVDVLYSFTDNTISANMATVAMIANENKLPCIVGEKGMVDAGGLATYGIDYYSLGKLTAKQAVDILQNGADITKMPIEFLSKDDSELAINQEVADQLGITIPEDLK